MTLRIGLLLFATTAIALAGNSGQLQPLSRISDEGTGTDITIGDNLYNKVLLGNTDGFGQLIIDPDSGTVTIGGASFSVTAGRIGTSDGITPLTEGVGTIGGAADPFAGIYIGNNSVSYSFTDSLATYYRFAHLPDKSGTFILSETSETQPLAATVTAGGAGTNHLSAGDYQWKITFVTAAGETLPGDPSAIDALATPLTIDPLTQLPPALSNIPLGSSLVTARKIYRNPAAMPGTYKLVATISDNTTTTYTDNTADASLGANAPSSNTTASTINLPVSVFYINGTITPSGTTTAQTINKSAGSVNFAAGNSSKQVNNNTVTASSVIVATPATNDSTLKSVQAVPASGSFTLYGNASATAETRVNWFVVTPR